MIQVMTEPEDTELVIRAQEGDVLAFEELVQRYDRQVLTIALSHVQNSEDAKDIYQEVFIRVYRALKSFRHESKFSTWLHRITTNVCLTHRSKKKRHVLASLDEEIDTEEGTYKLSDTLADTNRTDQQTMNSQISEQVQAAMHALSPQQKMVFTLRHYEGFKLKEIASMMNCAEGTVKKYLFTATERLRDQLKEVY